MSIFFDDRGGRKSNRKGGREAGEKGPAKKGRHIGLGKPRQDQARFENVRPIVHHLNL